MAHYIPYVAFSRRQSKFKLSEIREALRREIQLNGMMLDYRLLSSGYLSEAMRTLGVILEKNPDAIILVDPRTDAFCVKEEDLEDKNLRETLKPIFRLAGYSDAEIKDAKNFRPEKIKEILPGMIEKLYKETNRIPDLEGSYVEISYFLPPYFVAERYGDFWYKLTLEAINISSEKYSREKKIIATIAINESILKNGAYVQRIIDDYRTLNVDGYIILPFGLDESKADKTKLVNLARLALGLKKTGRFVAVHVAEFGTVLVSLGVDAIICGICTRKTPSMFRKGGGGGGQKMIYVYSIFAKLNETRFEYLLQKVPEAYSCTCPICSRYAEAYVELTKELMMNRDIHYAYWKSRETKEYVNNPGKLLKALEKAKEYLDKYNEEAGKPYPFEGKGKPSLFLDPNYLEKWIEVLKIFSQRDSATT